MENIKFLQITDDQTNQSAYYKKYKYWARSEVLTAVMMKNQVFWDVTIYRPVNSCTRNCLTIQTRLYAPAERP